MNKSKRIPRIGDMIFLRDRGPGAAMIRFWSRRGAPKGYPDGFNHVAMCIGDDLWLSAEPSGIKKVNTTFLTRNSVEAVLMCFTGTDKIGWWAAQYSIAHMGEGYDFLGVVGFAVHRLTGIMIHWGGRQFCSEICLGSWIRALSEAGIPHSYRDPANTTPNDCFVWAMGTGFFRAESFDLSYV